MALFGSLDDQELESLASCAEVVEIPSEGVDLTRQGDFGHAVFAVVGGAADVTVDGLRVRQLGRGDVFGEIAVLSSGRRTATVTSTSPMRSCPCSSGISGASRTPTPGSTTPCGRRRSAPDAPARPITPAAEPRSSGPLVSRLARKAAELRHGLPEDVRVGSVARVKSRRRSPRGSVAPVRGRKEIDSDQRRRGRRAAERARSMAVSDGVTGHVRRRARRSSALRRAPPPASRRRARGHRRR